MDLTKTTNGTRAGLRAVIYARYSDPKQPERSIIDQIEMCRGYIERQGWVLALTHPLILAETQKNRLCLR